MAVLAGAGAELDVPVACVEAGRWDGSSTPFDRGGAVLPPRVRYAQTRSVTNSLIQSGARQADQGAVWQGVDDELAARGVRSRTAAYHDGAGRGDRLRRVADAGPIPGQHGVVVCSGRRVVGADLFGNPRLLEAYWRPIVDGYRTVPGSRDYASIGSVFRLLSRLRRADRIQTDAVGLGIELRLQGPKVIGQAVMHEGVATHVSAFDPRAFAA